MMSVEHKVIQLTEMQDETGYTYDFEGLPLTPANAEKIVFMCCSGLLSREQIITKVYDFHIQNGGNINGVNHTQTIRRALGNLVKRGEIPAQPMRGYYSINNNILIDAKKHDQSVDNLDAEILPVEMPVAVYAYYFPTYEKYAILNGERYWPIKIGRTDRYVSDRISQQSTAFPESPNIIFSLNTENSKIVEDAIHAILIARGRSCLQGSSKAGLRSGAEWFYTNPGELTEILEFIGFENDQPL